MTRRGENLLGILKRLQCACECGTVDTYTEKVFADAADAGWWTPDERTEFRKAMTGFIPSFWPKALHKKVACPTVWSSAPFPDCPAPACNRLNPCGRRE